MTQEYWDRTRTAGTEAFRDEAERAVLGWVYPGSLREGDVSAAYENDPLVRAYIDGFVAGGEFAMEQFIRALTMKADLSGQLSGQQATESEIRDSHIGRF